ncbi:MAG: TatD family hydrolase [Lachnospiraceae bacterium]|nr:TatD family hydrolase [Lachnospiraceae bacterium]
MRAEMKDSGRTRLLDMHAHLSCFMGENGPGLRDEERQALAEQELELRRSSRVASFFSCGGLEEWEFMRKYRNREEVFLSFAIHPWNTGFPDHAEGGRREDTLYEERSREEAMRDAFAECDAVGETGMDSVWCDVPLSLQRRSFERQLQIAADLKKPVILHTKGMEREIAAMIRDFSEPVCVHWYSGDRESFEAFLEADCFFTLGPDLAEAYEKNALYRLMLREIPVSRLFVETDGISSIAWARGVREAELSEIPEVLAGNVDFIAEMKNMRREELRGRMWENLREFFRKTGTEARL